MNIIACIDDNNGILFNNRRQSRDKEVIKKIMDVVGENILLIHSFSKNLFEEYDNIVVNDNLLEEAKTSDFCFVENVKPTSCKNIHKVYLFKWNKKYPYDTTFDIKTDEYHLAFTEEFKGNSHDNITLEIYCKH